MDPNDDFGGGGLRGSKISFLGLKPTQDPMNNIFEQKKLVAEKNFGPPGPPTKKISDPTQPARPAPGAPKGGPDLGTDKK